MPRARITPLQKAEVVDLISGNPLLSDQDVAQRVSGGGVSPSAVARVRIGLSEAYHQASEDYARPGTGQPNVSPFPGPRFLDTAPRIVDTDAPPAPPAGKAAPDGKAKPDIGATVEKEAPKAALSLSQGTERFLDKIGPSVANLTVAIAQYATPDRFKPAIPSPEVAEIIMLVPARILMRHAHIQMDELSEDGRDIAALATALGTWALEMRQNYASYRQWQRDYGQYQQQPGGASRGLKPDNYNAGLGNANGAGAGSGQSAATAPGGGGRRVAQPVDNVPTEAGNPLAALFSGAQQSGNVSTNGANGTADTGRQSPGNVAFAAGALEQLYQADAVGRRVNRLG